MENVVAFEIARAALEKFGGDSMIELKANHASFMEFAKSLPLDPPTATIA
jgi:chorismate synthase